MEKQKMSWRGVNLHGSLAISRLCGEYVIEDHVRVPARQYRIKVFERRDDFLALPNLRFRTPDGSVDGICGLGASELDALQDALERVGELLSSKSRWENGDVEWADPRDF